METLLVEPAEAPPVVLVCEVPLTLALPLVALLLPELVCVPPVAAPPVAEPLVAAPPAPPAPPVAVDVVPPVVAVGFALVLVVALLVLLLVLVLVDVCAPVELAPLVWLLVEGPLGVEVLGSTDCAIAADAKSAETVKAIKVLFIRAS